MLVRTVAQAVRYERDPLWERSSQFRELVDSLVANPGARLLDGLDDNRRIAVEAAAAAKRWGGDLTLGDYRNAMERAMNETRQLVAAPRSDTPTADLVEAWRQPEAQDLWQRIIGEVRARRNAIPSLHCALGTMVVAGALGRRRIFWRPTIFSSIAKRYSGL